MTQTLRLGTAVAALTIGISAAAAQVLVMTPSDDDTWMIRDDAGTEFRVLTDPAGRPAECPDDAYFVSEMENGIPTRVMRCDENEELELRAIGADERTAAGDAFPEGSLLASPREAPDDGTDDEDNADTDGDEPETDEDDTDAGGGTETPTTPDNPATEGGAAN